MLLAVGLAVAALQQASASEDVLATSESESEAMQAVAPVDTAVYMDPTLPVPVRVEALLKQMTNAEKMAQTIHLTGMLTPTPNCAAKFDAAVVYKHLSF